MGARLREPHRLLLLPLIVKVRVVVSKCVQLLLPARIRSLNLEQRAQLVVEIAGLGELVALNIFLFLVLLFLFLLTIVGLLDAQLFFHLSLDGRVWQSLNFRNLQELFRNLFFRPFVVLIRLECAHNENCFLLGFRVPFYWRLVELRGLRFHVESAPTGGGQVSERVLAVLVRLSWQVRML